MPRIPHAPSVRQFVETWSKDFEEAASKAAGKDGRLSRSEARKLAARSSFGDDVVAYLDRTGKQSVSVAVLARDMAAYAQRAAEQAAGGDGRLSLSDGAKLPAELEDDFFLLRGRPLPGTPAPASALGEAKAALGAAAQGLWVTSETDAKLVFVGGQPLDGAPITADVVRAQLTAQHDALIGDVMYTDPSERSLAAKTPVEQRSAADFLGQLIDNVDPNDPVSVAEGQKLAALKRTLEAELTDLTVFRFGDVSISTFIVGRTRTGELAGLLTGQVET